MSKKQETKEAVKTTAQAPAVPVMYLGPNVLSKGLKTNTVYKQKPAELISTLQGEFSTIGRLFVPVTEVTQAMADLQKKGTPINLAYTEMKR